MVERNRDDTGLSAQRWLPWYGPAALAALLVVLLGAILVGMNWRVQGVLVSGVERELANARESILTRLEGNLAYLRLLASERADGRLTQEEFRSKGQDYVRDHPEFINFTWVSADFTIEDVAPRLGNEQILGLRLTLSEPARASNVAMETRDAVYTEVFEAIQGSPSFEVWVPVYREDTFLGLFGGVYSCERLLPTLFPVFGDHPGSLELIASGSAIVSRLSRIRPTSDTIVSELALDASIPGISLRLTRQGQPFFSSATLLVSGLCLILVLSMGWAMWALQRDAATIREARQFAAYNEQRFQILAESAPVPIVLCEDGVITFANAEAVTLLGAREDSLVGAAWADFDVDATPSAGPDDSVAGKVLGGQSIRRADGSMVDVALNTAHMEIDGRLLTQYILRDLTEQQRALRERLKLDAQIQHAQKLESLGVLAGGIAHDFNNLLVGILGYGDLTLLSMSPTAPGREHVHEIVKSAQRAADLCNQMLAYSGKGRFVVQSVNLSEVVEDMTHLLEVSISKKVSLRYRFEASLPAVDVDVTQIRQVIMNLITNASDAAGTSSASISVSTGLIHCDKEYLRDNAFDDDVKPGGYVYLEVSDTGCGMSKAIQRRIFEPFYTSKDTGRGLGLAAVLGIIRGHAGALKVYSEEGKGTTMKVLLPSSSQPAVPAIKPEQKESQWRGEGTILIVDDEEVVRTMTAKLFHRAGFSTLEACNGEEGVQLYTEKKAEIAAVLLDMTMPGISGEETFTQLRRFDPDVRVVLTSGYNEEDVTGGIAGKGNAGFIQKPFRAGVLIDTFRAVLGQ